MVLFKLEKGSATMLIVIAGLIMILLAGTLATGILGRVAQDLLGESVMCETYCAMQSEVREVGTLDWVSEDQGMKVGGGIGVAAGAAIGAAVGSAIFPGPGTVIGGGLGAAAGLISGAGLGIALGSSEEEAQRARRDAAIDYLVRPEGMGCYCGTEEERGEYMHIYSRFDGGMDDGSLGEFHLTSDNPVIHLQDDIIDTDGDYIFKHSGGLEECNGTVQDPIQGEEMEGLYYTEFYEGCTMISVLDGGDDCAVWGFEDEFTITNEVGKTIWEQAEEQEKDDLVTGFKENDPVYSLEIGEEFEIYGGARHESQRMLLEHYQDGTHEFYLHEPIVCLSQEIEARPPRDPLEIACQEQCDDQDKLSWVSGCFEEREDAGERYEELEEEYLPEEYDETQELCPIEPDEDDEENGEVEYGYPFCLCGATHTYHWVVDEEGEHI